MDSLIYRPWLAVSAQLVTDSAEEIQASRNSPLVCKPAPVLAGCSTRAPVALPALWGHSQGAGHGETLAVAHTCQGSTWPSTIKTLEALLHLSPL